jgi:hypothetical protein
MFKLKNLEEFPLKESETNKIWNMSTIQVQLFVLQAYV